ncbi:hypothetical protein MKX03_017038 [Papaver bracteatum]|nr:hypothetical protein MKX03_017038 [Papaver bracteatum]
MKLYSLVSSSASLALYGSLFLQILFSFPRLHILTSAIFILILTKLLYNLLSRTNQVYLIDFACYQPPSYLRASVASNVEHIAQNKNMDDKSREFASKVFLRSCVGSSSCFPSVLHYIVPEPTFQASREEVEDILFTLVEDLFRKSNIRNPKDIHILIVNCSLFCPTPSISSMIINKFNLRSNISSYNLSGMGCSAGLVSVSLAEDLLKVHKNSLALILSVESISNNSYLGKNRSMLLTNSLFRMGGAAILLSNRHQDRKFAKYSLPHIIRTTMAYDDQSYQSVFQEPDEDGLIGVSLAREITSVAGKALTTNITRLGPLVLPYSEQLKFGLAYIWHKIWPPAKRNKNIYVPNFKKAFKHFCIHAGGRAVIDVVQKSLCLTKEDCEASRMTLFRYGNTSSSSVWYELCYIEAKGRMKTGDSVWQIAFGSGFKCNSAVWKCISEINPTVRSAWSDRIHNYPVEVPEPHIITPMNCSSTQTLIYLSMLMHLLFVNLNFTTMMIFLKMMSMFIVELFYLLRTCTAEAVDENLIQTFFSFSKFHILIATMFVLILTKQIYNLSTSNKVYLIDFSCYQPPTWLRAPVCSNLEHYEQGKYFNKETMDFVTKLLLRSGIGSSTHFPRVMSTIPPEPCLEDSLQEVKDIVFTVVEDLFHKTNITNPKIIDILIVNCSMFSPTPSISSMIINKFQLRSNISSYTLSGMGCSAGLVSISLAKDLLKVHKNTLVLILSFEILTNSGYFGRKKSMLLSNTLFRMGGAAILLSNKRQDRKIAKYSLQHIIRTTMSYDNQSYRAVHLEPDEDGLIGVSLSKDITKVAVKALTTNITTLGPRVLPYSEQLRYGSTYIRHKISPPAKTDGSIHVPNFKKAFEHFCIHAGGRAVINVVQKSLRLADEDTEASRMTLYRYGNTSASSVWYELCYIEAKGRMKVGDRVWQIAFGSGFKCNSAVWKCTSKIDTAVKNAWSDRIGRYPVEVPEVFDY